MFMSQRGHTQPLSSNGNLATEHAIRKAVARDALRRFSALVNQRKCGIVPFKFPKTVILPDGTTYIEGIVKCQSAGSCPWCTPRKVAEKRQFILERCEITSASGGAVVMGTLTVHSPYGSPLKSGYGRLKAVKARYLRIIKGVEKLAGATHSVYAIEETFTVGRRWHPHIHALWFIPGPTDEAALAVFQQDAIKSWLRAAADVGVGPVSVSAQHMSVKRSFQEMKDAAFYVTDHGMFPEAPPTPSSSGTYPALKPFEILELARTTCEPFWMKAYNEFELANKGQHRITFHPRRAPIPYANS